MKTFNVSLNKSQSKKIFDFCQKHSVTHFYFAKDQGAYFLAKKGSTSNGDFENCLVYVKGCDPNKNTECYETARNRFGGDDFAESFEVDVLAQFVNSEYKRINFRFNLNSISISFTGL
ncbi:DUF3085 domain-containing protein [Pseudoalteromonas sp. SK20]|uniref:DUF3085 domain-containing protein n=1 Tax=Pseudoalteromonas sp. SK20 TaxID=1938367 RepID=UPI0009787B56|nr:DUF3085 domain-containing protein [Pseudoalteromonas sp. SK20]